MIHEGFQRKAQRLASPDYALHSFDVSALIPDDLTIPPVPEQAQQLHTMHERAISQQLGCESCARFKLMLLKAVRKILFGRQPRKRINNAKRLGISRAINKGAMND